MLSFPLLFLAHFYPMKITLNGAPTEVSAQTVPQLLHEIGLAEKPVIIEHNKVALLKKEHQSTQLCEGDSLEVITLAAGG